MDARACTAILEYVMPMESRRPDCILLVDGAVVVLEFKGKRTASQADIDQVAAYARDLRCYHRSCEAQHVHAVVVPTRAHGDHGEMHGVAVCGPDAVDALVQRLRRRGTRPTTATEFLDVAAYRPLPSLVAAARELMATGSLRRIHRAAAATEPTLHAIQSIIRDAARTRSRHLVLVTGAPGAGKTLVGLQTVHAHWLDHVSAARGAEKPACPAVFLSGNGPLVEVLQYELRGAGGGGKTFVRGVKDYMKRYMGKSSLVPPEHVLVFDEAQRAYDRTMVAEKHEIPLSEARSEPESFVEFAMRVPEWCVVIGLIGGGQEIHKGEEAGLAQWRSAIESLPSPASWTVHMPPGVASAFGPYAGPRHLNTSLALETGLRYHLASDLHRFVGRLLDGDPSGECRAMAERIQADGFHLRLTRDLDTAKAYLRARFADEPEKRFGLVASSRDRALVRFGVANDFQSTKRLKFGPWYGDAEDDPSGLSCRHLKDCVTEFGAQGLELDGVLLAWGTDLRREGDEWTSKDASRYQRRGAEVRDPHQLRINSYRVLLTRARETLVIFVPPMPGMDETARFLIARGFQPLERNDGEPPTPASAARASS
jgi:hypothetical protein